MSSHPTETSTFAEWCEAYVALLAERDSWETTARNAGKRVAQLEAKNQRLREALGEALAGDAE